MPRVESEGDRLNTLAYATDLAMGGSWLAPVTVPRNILDVGCGTGLWAYTIGRRFPDARVTGVDVDGYLLDKVAPPNFEFQEVNVLGGLPFEDATFDYVHQRLMVAAIPPPKFKGAVAELVRVTEPGGWVELLETLPLEVEPSKTAFVVPEGPATTELWSYFKRLGDTAGLDTSGTVPRLLELYLRESGLTNMGTRTVAVPIGEWGEEWQGQAGRLLASSFRSVFLNLIPRFGRLGASEDRCRELIAGFLAEATENKATTSMRIAFGQRP
jgi:ubiquinone/menaquinone biosynthesis C-methylase UbiE